MEFTRILAMLLSLHANVSRQRLEDIASAIASAASTPYEARILCAIEFEETSLRPARYEFGVTQAAPHLQGHPLSDWAATSLRIWRAGFRRHNEALGGFFYYYSGRWVQNTRGHTREFRRMGRLALAYAHRCLAVAERLRHTA